MLNRQEDKKRDREEQMNRKAKSAGHEPSQQRQNKGDKSYFQKRSSYRAPSVASAPVQPNRYAQKS